MKYLQIILLIILFFPILNFAQNCGYIHSPDEYIERVTEGYASRVLTGFTTRNIIRIPVVVHVIWKNPSENISDAQIQSQIDVLNQDFRKKNIDFRDVPGSFKTVSADCEIEFCLAQTDTAGRPTTGITRRQTGIDAIGTAFSNNKLRVYYSELGGTRNWKPDSFLNIWVCNMGTLLGFTTSLKDALIKKQEDGVIIDYRVFGTIGTASNNSQHNKGRTATHEVGHYFNLLHIWGSDSTCIDDDLVTDTPLQAAPYTGCPPFPQLSCGTGNMFMNFMDYTDDNCMGLFTIGQKVRMLAALTEFRPGLLRGGYCMPTSVKEISVDWLIYPNPTRDALHIKFKTDISRHQTRVSIIDYSGRVVLSEKKATNQSFETASPANTASDEMLLSTAHLPEGFYTVHIEIGNQIYFKKIVIIHSSNP